MNYDDELCSYIAQTNEAREDLFQNLLHINPWPFSHRNIQQFFKPYDTSRLDTFAIEFTNQLFKEPLLAFIGNIYLCGLAFGGIFYHLYRTLSSISDKTVYVDETPLLSCALHTIGALYCMSLTVMDLCYALLVNCSRLLCTIPELLCNRIDYCAPHLIS